MQTCLDVLKVDGLCQTLQALEAKVRATDGGALVILLAARALCPWDTTCVPRLAMVRVRRPRTLRCGKRRTRRGRCSSGRPGSRRTWPRPSNSLLWTVRQRRRYHGAAPHARLVKRLPPASRHAGDLAAAIELAESADVDEQERADFLRRAARGWHDPRYTGRPASHPMVPFALSLREASELSQRLAELVDEVELQKVLGGPFDESDAVVTVNAGVGGLDAQDWAEMVERMYQQVIAKAGQVRVGVAFCMREPFSAARSESRRCSPSAQWAKRRGFQVQTLVRSEGEGAGIKSSGEGPRNSKRVLRVAYPATTRPVDPARPQAHS